MDQTKCTCAHVGQKKGPVGWCQCLRLKGGGKKKIKPNRRKREGEVKCQSKVGPTNVAAFLLLKNIFNKHIEDDTKFCSAAVSADVAEDNGMKDSSEKKNSTKDVGFLGFVRNSKVQCPNTDLQQQRSAPTLSDFEQFCPYVYILYNFFLQGQYYAIPHNLTKRPGIQ